MAPISITHLTHRLQVLLLVTLLFLFLFGNTLGVYADEAIQVMDNTYQVQFAQGITFRLQVQAKAEIKGVILYYRLVNEGVTVKVPLTVAPGENEFSHTWELEPGDIPVGAGIEYYWRIVDGEGHERKTSTVSFRYEDDRFAWKTLAGDKITLYWYGSDEAQARHLLDYATKSLARLQDEMGVDLDRSISIYAYQSKSDMSLALPRKSEVYDERIVTLGVVVDEGTLLLLGSHPDVEHTIAHELAHVVVGLVTDNPYAEVPRWLDEGLAMYSEGELPAANRRALEQAIRRDQLISVRSLSGYVGDPAQVDLFYGEVYSLVEFMLRTYGKEKMAELLAAIREGLYQEEALQRVYGFGLDELDAQWRKSLGLLPRGALTLTPSPTPRPAPRSCIPCPGTWLGVLMGAAVAISWRRHAGAS
ncbi:MAG: peptidase MA family metallohydrolase [Anaerolineae bacterium]